MSKNKTFKITLSALAFLLLATGGVAYAASEQGTERSENRSNRGNSEEMVARREARRSAVENNDYEAFLEIAENSFRQVEVHEELFNRLVEAHSLREEGEYGAGRAIMEELGFSKRNRGHRGNGLRDGSGMGRNK